MIRHLMVWGLALLLTLSLFGCAGGEKQAETAKQAEKTTKKKEEQPEPQTPTEMLDQAGKAMGKGNGWTFNIQGSEGLTLQGQKNYASYQGVVELTNRPKALHSKGTITSKGKKKSEEIFAMGDTVYVKVGTDSWKKGTSSDPEMKSKVEDPTATIDDFRRYLNEARDFVSLPKGNGDIHFRVTLDSRKLPEVQHLPFVNKAMTELELKKLQQAGIPVNKSRLTLDRYEETLILDAKTYRIKSHQIHIRFQIPYGNQTIVYEQQVKMERSGTLKGQIHLPAEAQ